MKNTLTLIQKEYLEYLRNHKLYILTAIFIIMGIMNPLIAKMTPWLVEQLAGDIPLQIPEPTIIDSWIQFFKNISQIALIVFIIMFNSCINHEIQQGTLINLLTKGLARQAVIVSKFISISLLWTILYLISAMVTWGYNCYYFSGTINNLPIALFCLWLFGIFIIGLIILGNVLFKNNYGGLLTVGIFIIIGLFFNGFNILSDYNPIVLFTSSNAIMTNSTITCTSNIVITIILTFITIICSIIRFNRQEI